MSKATERMRDMLMEATSRVATTERLFTYYIMNMLPPDNVELTNEVQEWLSVLPAYDSSVSQSYFISLFGNVKTSSSNKPTFLDQGDLRTILPTIWNSRDYLCYFWWLDVPRR
jgi:hypothetical protein